MNGYLKNLRIYEEMLYVAGKLSEGIPHVRVDLYNVNGKIYFGEMTFFMGRVWNVLFLLNGIISLENI